MSHHQLSQHFEQSVFIENQSGLVHLLAKCCEMAGLLHDLGKGSEQFQKKLAIGVSKDVGIADPIRHEVVSVLMVSPMLKAMRSMTHESELEMWCDQHLQSLLRTYKTGPGQSSANRSQRIASTLSAKIFGFPQWSREHVIDTSISWMILAHHRLPEGRQCEEDGIIPTISYGGKFGGHYFLKVVENADTLSDGDHYSPAQHQYSDKDFNANLTLCDLTKDGVRIEQPWHNREWRDQVFNCFKTILRVTDENHDVLPAHALEENCAWSTSLALMGRAALVYADYIVSSEKVPSGTVRQPGTVYANTIKVDNHNQYADSLLVHLLGVGKKARQLCEDLFINPHSMITSLPSLSLDERKTALPGMNIKSSDPRYQWQDVVLDTFQSQRSNTPFFGTVIGKTGAGKTRGNIMLMHALKEDMRFTCAIGLRSLVKQTYAAYREPFIGLTQDHVALLIGESQGQSQVSHDEPSGSGNDLEEDAKLLLGDYRLIGNDDCEHPLSKLLDGQKQRAMLGSPVQVMTVDHIMPGASLGRSSELKLLMHLMSTDIILDEIDDYPVKSQAALMRMAFISGVFGRSFVLSSATATPIIQKAFFNAWREGNNQHRRLFQNLSERTEAFAVLVSHVAGNEALRTSLDGFESACDAFVAKVIEEASLPGNIRHRVALADIALRSQLSPTSTEVKGLYSNPKSLSKAQHQQLLETISGAHSTHHVEHEGVRVSSGFVRFNHIKNAQHLALALSQENDQTLHIIPICYHAAMLYSDRLSVETLLAEMNCRKSTPSVTGDLRIFEHPYVRQGIDDAKRMGKTDVVFVLSTTNIIEVGRDHDYDWAILEPSSTRSLVQSCGRVWRHRLKTLKADFDNIWILPMTVRGLLEEEDQTWKPLTKRLWTMHGIEDEEYENAGAIVALKFPLTPWSAKALKQLGVDHSQLPKSGRHERSVLASKELWGDAIETKSVHAGLCLEIPKNVMAAIMTAMELAQQCIHLNGVEDQTSRFTLLNPAGIHYANLPAHRLCENHPKRRRLRDSDEGFSLVYDVEMGGIENGYPTKKWRAVDRDGKEMAISFSNRTIESGTLYVPPSLEQFIATNPSLSSRIATEIGLRAAQYESLGEWHYLYGIGLCKNRDLSL